MDHKLLIKVAREQAESDWSQKTLLNELADALEEANNYLEVTQDRLDKANQEISRSSFSHSCSLKESFEAGYRYCGEGCYPDMTLQENIDQAYIEWLDSRFDSLFSGGD